MTKSNTPPPPENSLPPQIPGTAEQLQRAITLLGNRTKADLKTKPRQELISLIGTYPSATQAGFWKRNLKILLKANQPPSP
jgi:hypothetical protein